MTHDPLCSVLWPCDHPAHFKIECSCICGRICQCDLIAEVRDDERQRAVPGMWTTAVTKQQVGKP
jgi:hypothetical protein